MLFVTTIVHSVSVLLTCSIFSQVQPILKAEGAQESEWHLYSSLVNRLLISIVTSIVEAADEEEYTNYDQNETDNASNNYTSNGTSVYGR